MDVEEIEAVLVRYAPAIDSMDRSLLWTCFTDRRDDRLRRHRVVVGRR